MSEVANSIRQMEELISKGKNWKAVRLAENLKCEYSITTNADFWFEYGLAVRLTNRNEALLKEIRKRMRKCDNYNQTMDGDWLRDDILDAIRKHKVSIAKELLPELKELYRGDKNRLATATMVEGEIAYLCSDFGLACLLHLQAMNMWLNRWLNRNATNNQWYMNNQFHLLKAMVANHTNSTDRRQIANNVIDSDESHIRRLRGKLINSGHLGNSLDDLLMRIRFV